MLESIHICFVVYSYEKTIKDTKDLLSAYHSLTGWCNALVESGCKVTALLRFHKEEHIVEHQTDYYFLKDKHGEQLKPWQIPFRLHQKAKAIDADVYHGHNMDKPIQHAHLKYLIGDKKLLIQNHAETPKKAWRIFLQRYLLKNIDAFLFCAKGQEEAWCKHQVITTNNKVYFAMEASTYFRKKDRKKAQQRTKIKGDPIFLWVGNLNANKDPITILKAFLNILSDHPRAQLYMIYRFDDLIKEVKQLVQSHDVLVNNVHLLGAKQYEALEDYYSSADYFILGSHHEGSGYALMESMACGCIPIVTAIPSFCMMTNNGQVGLLWEAGNELALENQIKKALSLDKNDQSKRALLFFEQELSYRAIAAKMKGYYIHLMDY